jgi:H+/gluconate symporter-like permease
LVRQLLSYLFQTARLSRSATTSCDRPAPWIKIRYWLTLPFTALSVASLVGFGAVIATLPAFAIVRDWILGISPALMHRVAVIGSGTLDILPHNGAVVTVLAVCGSTHRESYFDIVMVGIVGAILALVAVILIGTLFGSF